MNVPLAQGTTSAKADPGWWRLNLHIIQAKQELYRLSLKYGPQNAQDEL